MKTIFRVIRWLRRYPGLASAQLFCACTGVLMALVYPEATGQIIDQVIPEKRYDLLGFWVMAAVGAFFFRDALNALRIILNNTFEQKVIYDLRSDLYAHLQRLPLPWFDTKPTGDIMTTLSEDVTAVERVLIDGIEQGLVAVLQLTAAWCYLFFWCDRTLACWALLPVPFLAAGALYYTSTARHRYKNVRQATSALNSLLMDNIGGIRQIKSYTREEAEHTRFNSVSDILRQATLKVMRAWAGYNPGMAFIAALGSVIVLWLGSRRVLDGEMSVGDLTRFLFSLALFYDPIGRLHQLNQIIQAGRAAGDRVFAVLDTPPEEPADAPAEERTAEVQGHVEYKNVSFAYNERVATLTNVSLEAKPGQTVALVGPTGAGKSTIINLLCRFYDLGPKSTSGEILLDGHSIRDATKTSLRRAIGYVTQESFLFNGSVRDNLMLARPHATDEELWASLDAANAGDFVRRLPQQLETAVGERGVRLSVGEKQRLSIARALLKNPPILLLDEATASVDTETERQIQEALDRLMVGRTSFVIAHRLSTVRHADHIYVLDQGRVLEEGTHDALLARGGMYADLCQHALMPAATDGSLTPASSAPAVGTLLSREVRELREKMMAAELKERRLAELEADLARVQVTAQEHERESQQGATLRAQLEADLQSTRRTMSDLEMALHAAQFAAQNAADQVKQIESAQAEKLQAMTAQVSRLEEELRQNQQTSARLASERAAQESATAELSDLKEQLSSLDQALAQKDAERARLLQQLEEIKTAPAAPIAALSPVAPVVDHEQVRALEKQVSTLEAQLSANASAAAQLEQERTARQANASELEVTRQRLAQLSEEATARQNALEAELAAARTAAQQALEASLAAPAEAPVVTTLAATPVANDEAAKLKKELNRLDRDLERSEEDRLSAQSDLYQLKDQLEEQQAAHRAAEAEAESRLDALQLELDQLRQKLAADEKRQNITQAELTLIRTENDRLRAAGAELPTQSGPSVPPHPELPLQLPPSRPMVVFTSRRE
jgi:ATP-binding cassette, subfamily B, bacterial